MGNGLCNRQTTLKKKENTPSGVAQSTARLLCMTLGGIHTRHSKNVAEMKEELDKISLEHCVDLICNYSYWLMLVRPKRVNQLLNPKGSRFFHPAM